MLPQMPFLAVARLLNKEPNFFSYTSRWVTLDMLLALQRRTDHKPAIHK